jgi:drug/metabolite transporter (DMT)-like permease
MDMIVFCTVLLAALLHAGWNAIVKIGLDRFSSVLLLALVQAAIALPVLPLVARPAWEAWPWIAASAILHSGYKISLIRAYAHGDLSQVYPLARGAAPLIVAIVSIPVLGESLKPVAILAVLTVAGGIFLMSFKGGVQLRRMSPATFAYALATAAFTASYTLVDGIGARVAGSASGFILWMVLGDAIGMLIYASIVRGWAALPALASAWKVGFAAGAMSLGSYWIAVWAFTQAPIALVAALRETSVLFAMLIAVLFLKEPSTCWRWAAAGTIGIGIALMRL